MEGVWQCFSSAGEVVEEAVEDVEAWLLIVVTVTVTLASITLLNLYRTRRDVYEAIRAWVYRLIRGIPAVNRRMKDHMAQARKDIETSMFASETEAIAPLHALPPVGWSGGEVVAAATKVLAMGKYDWREGRISGGAFSGKDEAFTQLLTEMYGRYALSNPLHSDIFPGARKMEAEIVRMTLDLFQGDSDACGCMTTGGSESLLLALKAARDLGRDTKGITQPEIIMCYTAHAGFDKAASILGVKLRKVKMDPLTCKVDLKAMRGAITSNTVMLVASAPQFPHGIVDDVEGVGSLGEARSIPVHVDCCMGGFILPFMKAAGYAVPAFDFQVPGVTSISADTHKYGQAPKGSSVLMYRSHHYLHYQYFVTPNWPGGIYATHTVPGSRAGGLIAVCWASLMYHGFQGYTKVTKGIIATARNLKQRLGQVPGVKVYGDPLTSIVAFHTTEVDILKVGDVLSTKGWHLTFLQYPPGLHVCLTSLQATDDFVDGLVCDLKEAMMEVGTTNSATSEGIGKVYGTAATIPDKTMVGEAAKVFLQCYYDTLPDPA